MYSFQFQGKLPELTKQCMHVAVSMVNRCEF
jgi:AhpD family alkylhydroperoxidase